MEVRLINSSYSGITNGAGALQSAKSSAETGKFEALLKSMGATNLDDKTAMMDKATLSSSQVAQNGRLNGDYTSGFKGAYKGADAKHALPTGAAANQANPNVKTKTIDKTSELYEKALELESYFVKQMLSAMRSTVKMGSDDFASGMYQDMLWDEYATSMTKNAGFGLADQIYNQLA